ncbi:MAG: right-handed parallel beta-helix repeat-containing protein [Armatimonadetes bacterium]|nr:right-handed parallel beta-helix repeat-containing protein [Armatimonadota bacterium]
MLQRILLALIIVIFAINYIYAEESWLDFTNITPEAPTIDLNNSTTQNVAFQVEVPGMNFKEVVESGTIYQRANIPDWVVLNETGKPELPVIRQLIAIPECDDVNLSINVTNDMYFDNYYIYPAPDYEQIQNPDQTVYMAEVFAKDETAYNINQFFPEVTAEIKEIGYLREQKIAEVWIYPVQFNPVTQQLKANTNYEIELSFDNPISDVNLNTGIFNNVSSSSLLNYVSSGISASVNVRAETSGNVEWLIIDDTSGLITADYIIITADEFFDINNHNPDIEALANHRAAYNGFDVAIVNVEDVMNVYPGDPPHPDYDNEQKIRNFVKSVYENGTANHTLDGKLAYVLLIGDTKEEEPEPMPTSYEVFPSDYYYSCVTESNGIYDDLGDLYLGRLCTGDVTELHNIVEKTISYETEADFYDWKKNILLTAGDFGPQGGNVHNYLTNYFNYLDNELIQDSYNVTQVKQYEIGHAAAQAANVENMNNGDLIANYFGHGGVTVWQSFTPTQFNQLTNEDKQMFVISLGCNTGYLDHNYLENCMGEYFTNAIDKGAIGFLGATRLTGVPGNSNFMEKLHEAFWQNMSFIGGEFVLEGKINCSLYEDESRYKYIYFGDPAINLMAEGYLVTENTEISGDDLVLNSTVYVTNNATLTIGENSVIYLQNGSKIVVEEGATLFINPGVSIYCSEGSKIKVEEGGSFIAIGTESDPILFASSGEEPWVGIELWEAEESHICYCQIENAETGVLLWYANNGTFMNNEINNCNIGLLAKGDVYGSRDIELNDFNNNQTGIFLHHIGSQLPNTQFYVDHNTIVGDEGDGIYVNNCGSELYIGDNIITNNKYGISVEYSDGCKLWGSDSDYYLIEANNIGVCFFQSTVDMEDLTILNNEDYGLVFLSDSHPTIDSNRIINNGTAELYCNYGHPVMADGHNDIVHTSAGYLGYLYRDDVRNINCCFNWWGSDPPDSEKFYPTGNSYFIYDPWDESSNHPLPGGGIGEDSDARIAYNSALEAEGNEDYSSAAVMYNDIINTYPLSEEALLSLRRLFICEKNAYGNMYNLKIFYEELANNCPEDTVFCLLSRNLAIDCDKENELYEDALLQYSDILESPIDEADSIFTQINIMNTLLELEGSGRNTVCIENLPENIRRLNPADVQDFQIKSKNLLDYLLGEPEPEEEPSDTFPACVSLHRNYPNPFNPTTTISFSIPEESKVDLSIYNIKGQKVRNLVSDDFKKGIHSVIWNGVDESGKSIASGVYFYKLNVNGITKQIHKCILMK